MFDNTKQNERYFFYKEKIESIYPDTETMKLLYLSILTALLLSCNYCTIKKMPEVSSGKLIRIENFQSKFVNPRNIDVWLTEGYNSVNKHAVIYMNDGQMLFDSTTTWNKQEWHVDEVITKLILKAK